MTAIVVGICFLSTLFLTFYRWRWLLHGLLIFMPVVGFLVLRAEQSTVLLLAKDIFFVLPLYVMVFIYRPQLAIAAPVPQWLTLTIIFLSLVVIVQMANPGVANLTMAIIGLKVWLLYIPLTYIVAAVVATRMDLVTLLRTLLIIALVPGIVGLIQWSLSGSVGYRATMIDFYGEESAAAATQNFAEFTLGGALRRLPSTFTNPHGFFIFSLAAMCLALASQAIEPNRVWRFLARCSFVLAFFAGLISGIRSGFVLLPLAAFFYFSLPGRGLGIIVGIIGVPSLFAAFTFLMQFDAEGLLTGLSDHAEGYSNADFVLNQVSFAFENSPFGQGTGTNTVSARHGLNGATSSSLGSYEVQYAKVAHELGIFGLVPFVSLVIGIAYYAVSGALRLKDQSLRRAHCAFAGFLLCVLLHFFKAWTIDIDPGNVYFWLFLGLMFLLRKFDAEAIALKNQTNYRRSGINRQKIVIRRGPYAPQP